MIVILLLIAIVILLILILFQLNDTHKYLKELNEDDKTKKMKKLQKFGLISNSEVFHKLKHYRDDIKYSQAEDDLQELRAKGLLTHEEYDEKLNHLYKIKQNIKDAEELKKQTGEHDIVTYPKEYEKSWLCVCGKENNYVQINCSHCKRNQDYVLSNY
ncbi:hypothetical protein [Tenuibacillus multivorans]|uniref:Short C-terminal domain-containing protein n=1 Tax=Tenuibacillus multivorans TaxID=237069 RepID=A0A1G9YHT6_9BACI|nr:hypothetical protein [Tenuibacillus multivorans]GEL78526.1 hypothetical protein TMU01_27610 [Tenuibacillus multivorans]SDN08075.1 hypothetical protein SAMN05216498_1387 [Tenuibacillus multivorans]